jgi:hypothetical protein
MNKAIVSEYFGKFVVSKARVFVRYVDNGQVNIDRGTNIFGEHLGYIKRTVHLEKKYYVEGEALSQGFLEEAQAINFAAQIGFEIVKPFIEISDIKGVL